MLITRFTDMFQLRDTALKFLRVAFIFALRCLRRLLNSVTSLVGKIVYGSQKNALVPIEEGSILLLPAQELAIRIIRGEMKSEEVVKAYIRRIGTVNPHINAVVNERFSDALVEAKSVDSLVLNYKGRPDDLAIQKPFLGVPFSLKNSYSAKGFPWDVGNPMRTKIKSQEDSAVVLKMREAGAILIVMTNVPEICLWYNCHNYVYGETKNPYDLSRIPGGSSGGEAALISAGGSVMGLGTDVAGSLRFPAFFCGIFSHKPSVGVVDLQLTYPLHDFVLAASKSEPDNTSHGIASLLCAGPLCRYSQDLRPLMKVLASEESSIHLQLDKTVNFSKTKFYYVMELRNIFTTPLQHEIREAMEKVIEHFRVVHGAQVEAVYMPSLENGWAHWMATMRAMDMPTVAELLNDNKGEANIWLEFLRLILGRPRHTLHTLLFSLFEKIGPYRTHPIFQYLLKDLENLRGQFNQLFSTDHNVVFLMPPFPEVAPYLHETIFKCGNPAYAMIFSLLGYPVTQCPTGLGRSGLPIGLQVVSDMYKDHVTISVAEEIETVFGGWISP